MKDTIVVSLVVTYSVVTYLAYLCGRGYRLEKLRPGETDPITLRPDHIHNEVEDLSYSYTVLSRVPHLHEHLR